MHYNYLAPSISMIRVVYIIVALFFLSGGTFADTLSMKIENIQDANGNIMISIGDVSAFDGKGPNALQIILPARTGSVSFTTDAVPTRHLGRTRPARRQQQPRNGQQHG